MSYRIPLSPFKVIRPKAVSLSALTLALTLSAVAMPALGQWNKESQETPNQAADVQTADKGAAGKGTADKAAAQKGPAEKGQADKDSAEKGPADKGAAEKGSGEKGQGGKPGGGGGFGGGGGGGRRRGGGGGGGDDAPDAKTETAYDFHLVGPDGKDVPLSQYKDKYVVVVNLGRKSSYNDQLPALIKLNDTYKDKGLVVIGVPSNEFGAAEPGTPVEVAKAYADAKVDFPVMGVSKLTGDDALPFFTYLTKGKAAPAGGGVAWNYTKFIVDKKGAIVARLDPDVAPDSPEMLATINQILEGTYKPKKEPGGGRGGAEAMGETN